eukprot:s1811_g4.t1
MDVLAPLTTMIEWVWCATQVGITRAEVILFSVTALMVMALGWHVLCWQKKILLMLQSVQSQLNTADDTKHGQVNQIHEILQSVQTQLNAADEAKQSQADQIREILDLISQAETVTEIKNIAASVGTLKQQLLDAVSQLGSETGAIKEIPAEVGIVKKHLLEVLTHLATMKSVGGEVSSLHKLIGTVTTDCGKLGGMFNRLTDTHTLMVKLPNSQQVETALERVQKSLEDYVDKVQKQQDRKLEDLIEKTAVLRMVLEQKCDKQITTYKDMHSHVAQQVNNAISLLRGLGPAVPEIKRVADMVTMGRDASSQAQQTLQQNTETAQAVEDRLVRIEPLLSGLVDQMAELETRIENIQTELPTLQEILTRLPKLPTRKPPVSTDRVSTDSAGSGSAAPNQGVSTGLHTIGHPTTPPTSLGPPHQQSSQQAPVMIPVSLDAGGGANAGIQLRLSEHLNTQPQPQVCFNDGRQAPNFLITPIPAQQTTGDALLHALINPRR